MPHPLWIKVFFSFISAAKIASVSDPLVIYPLLLPLSYLKPIVQVYNGLFNAAYSEQQVTSSFITVCTMQMTADWMVVDVWNRRGAGRHTPSWSVSWLWGCQSEGRSGRHLACFPEPFISCWEPSSPPTGPFSKQQDMMPATQYVPQLVVTTDSLTLSRHWSCS